MSCELLLNRSYTTWDEVKNYWPLNTYTGCLFEHTCVWDARKAKGYSGHSYEELDGRFLHLHFF